MPACTAMILLRTITSELTLRKVMPSEVQDADARPGGLRLDPEAEIADEDHEDDQADDGQDQDPHDQDDLQGIVR